MHLHLPDNSGVTIRALGDVVMRILNEIAAERRLKAETAAKAEAQAVAVVAAVVSGNAEDGEAVAADLEASE